MGRWLIEAGASLGLDVNLFSYELSAQVPIACIATVVIGKQESRLLTELVQAGVEVRGFMREPGSLEAVFMQLTNHEEERVVLSYEADFESGL